MIRVAVTSPDGSVQLRPFLQDRITFGSAFSNDIILEGGNISAWHGRIAVRDDELLIVDLSSEDGVYVNGERIAAPRPLRDKDVVDVGAWRMACRYAQTAVSPTDLDELEDYEPPPELPASGGTFGPFHLEEREFQDDLTESWLARRQGEDTPIVVKIMSAEASEEPTVTDLLEEEADVLRMLAGPGLVAPIDTGEADCRPYLVMEYQPWLTTKALLSRLRARMRLIPVDLVCAIGARTAETLHRMHEARTPVGGVVHANVTPANIAVTFTGSVLLLGFTRVQYESRLRVINPGSLVGSSPYLSPEQTRGVPLTGRSDQFSLATVLYELLTNMPPFAASTPIELVTFMRRGEFLPPRRRNPAVGPQLDDIIRRALAPDPAERFSSCAELATELQSLTRDSDGSRLAEWMRRSFTEK